jgi:hypothetical protein
MRRQAEMVAELVNLAVPGQRQGSEYAPPPDAEVLARLGDKGVKYSEESMANS